MHPEDEFEFELRQKIIEHLKKVYNTSRWGTNSFIRDKIKETADVLYNSEFYQSQYIRPLKKRIVELEGMHVLNIGCGLGGLDVALAKEGAIVTGIDIDAESIEIAKIRLKRYPEISIRYVYGSAIRVPLKNKQFDLVISIGMLEHVSKYDARNIIKEMMRLAKPGGYFYIIAHPHLTFPYDMHFQLFFVNWLPKPIKIFFIRRLRPYFLSRLDESSPHGGTRNVTNFEIIQVIKYEVGKILRCWPDLFEMKPNRPVNRSDRYLGSARSLYNKSMFFQSLFTAIIKVLNQIHMEMSVTLLIQKKNDPLSE